MTTGEGDRFLIASGSEVALVVGAHEALAAQGIRSRVVSMPSWDIFEHQAQAYRESVLPPGITARIAVEQGSVLGWDRYVGATGATSPPCARSATSERTSWARSAIPKWR